MPGLCFWHCFWHGFGAKYFDIGCWCFGCGIKILALLCGFLIVVVNILVKPIRVRIPPAQPKRIPEKSLCYADFRGFCFWENNYWHCFDIVFCGLPSKSSNRFCTSCAVKDISPCISWPYTPKVSIFLECPPAAFTSPSGRACMTEKEVCRSS